MLRFSTKKPSFAEKTRFIFVLCTLFLYEPKGKVHFGPVTLYIVALRWAIKVYQAVQT